MFLNFIKRIIFHFSLGALIFGCIAVPLKNTIIDSSQKMNNNSIRLCANDEKETQKRDVVQTPFQGTATTIHINDNVSSCFYYPRQYHYYKYRCINSRRCVSFNYSGPDASLRIFYSNFFLDNDYLVSVPNINNAVDCYLFDQDGEYIIEISPYSIPSPSPYSFQLVNLTLNTLTNHEKYVLHQTMDSFSNVGYHYEIKYLDVNDSSSTSTNYYINSYSPNTSFVDEIDNNHWFYSQLPTGVTDDRRVVNDTGYDEYSAIAYASSTVNFNTVTYGIKNRDYVFSGTFISETKVVTAAHAIFPVDTKKMGTTIFYIGTGLNKEIVFTPGVNDYNSSDYYGKYWVNELYSSVSYILQYFSSGEDEECANYDWAICLTTKIENGTRNHSYMGISGFSYSELLSYWPYARSAGYPIMYSNPTNISLFEKTLWASYPLENHVVINGKRVESSDIVISSGNSGGPLYMKNVSIINGQPVKSVYLLGIATGSKNDLNNNCYTSYFYRNTALIVNIARHPDLN